MNAITAIATRTNAIVSHRLLRMNGPVGPLIACDIHGSKNLTATELQAVNSLKNNENIIIKPADKGGAVVIMDKELYKLEALRQLHNTNYYREIDHPLADITVPRINKILSRLVDSGFISDKQYQHLSATVPTSHRSFYLLPKVHKNRDKWPHNNMPEGRPIVSDCGSETYNICKFIDYFLKPLATKHPSYIQDTYDFVDKIRDRIIPQDAFIVTGDITALYTNMDIDRSLAVVREAFFLNPDTARPDQDILALLEIALRFNYFEFANKLFLQICGTAMGKSFAPNLANIYLLKFDKMANIGFHIKPLLYSRFIDDTFFIWPGSLQDLNEFEIFLNSLIPGIKITLTPKREVAEFLDTRVYKLHMQNKTILKTTVYFKDTDTHQLLHGKSFHPRHTVRGILKSQFIRFKRLCSTRYEYDQACHTLYAVLRNRGYARSLFRHLKRHVWESDFVLKRKSQPDDIPLWPIIHYYDSIGSRLMRHTAFTISKLEIANKHRLVKAFRVHRSLGELLVKSKFRG